MRSEAAGVRNGVDIELARRVREGIRGAGGGLSWLRTGDTIRIGVERGHYDALVPEAEIARRKKEAPPPILASQTLWQELFCATTGQLDTGAVMELAVKYRGVAAKTPRHNH
jgi:dihydroxy-acid dehydratase